MKEKENVLTEADVWAMLGARDVQLYRLERENARLREALAKRDAETVNQKLTEAKRATN